MSSEYPHLLSPLQIGTTEVRKMIISRELLA